MVLGRYKEAKTIPSQILVVSHDMIQTISMQVF